MDSLTKAQTRLRKYPLILAKCSGSATAYAKCVVQNDSVKKDECLKEFGQFKDCLRKAARDMKSSL